MFKRIKNNKQLKPLTFLAILLSITTIAFTYGAIKSGTDMAVSHGIIEDTVYINDLDSDYYYYTGQNYRRLRQVSFKEIVLWLIRNQVVALIMGATLSDAVSV